MKTNGKKSDANEPVQVFNWTTSPQFVSIYSNNVTITTNFFDTALVFSESTGLTGNAIDAERKVRVVMTPSQIKVLAMSLFSNIQQYEERFGVIPLPAEVLPPNLLEAKRTTDEEKKGEG
jgi:hypothetical protein